VLTPFAGITRDQVRRVADASKSASQPGCPSSPDSNVEYTSAAVSVRFPCYTRWHLDRQALTRSRAPREDDTA